MAVKIELENYEYDGLVDILRTCIDYNDVFVVDQKLAENILKQLEDSNY